MPDRAVDGISKTVPKSEGVAAVEQLYDGSLSESEFHMASNLKQVEVGMWVYTIFDNLLRGRCRIKELIEGHENPCSGKPRTLVMVECPGQRLDPPQPMKGHMGTRYVAPGTWPGE